MTRMKMLCDWCTKWDPVRERFNCCEAWMDGRCNAENAYSAFTPRDGKKDEKIAAWNAFWARGGND